MAFKTKLALTPQGFYDGEVIARMLEDRAARGEHLRAVGRFFLYYDRGVPRRARYRVEYAARRSDGTPDEDFLDYCGQAGWEYVGCIRGMLYVLRAVRPDAEELHTDPVVQAMSMRRTLRTLWADVIVGLAGLLLIAAIWLFSLYRAGGLAAPLALLVSDNRALLLTLFLLIEILAAALQLVDAVRLRRIRRALCQGETPPPDRRGMRRMQICRIVGLVSLAVSLVVCLTPFLGLFQRTEDIAGRDDLIYVPLAQLQSNPDYAPTPIMISGGHNIFARVDHGHSLLTSAQYQVYESGELTDYGMPAGMTDPEYLPRAVTGYYDLRISDWADDLARQLLTAAEAEYHRACEKRRDTPLSLDTSAPDCPGLDGAMLLKSERWQWLAVWKGSQVVFIHHTGPDNSAAALACLAEKLG